MLYYTCAGSSSGNSPGLKLAWELRSQTTLPLAWIAERLSMGTRGHPAWLPQRQGQGRQPTPNDQTSLGI